MKKLKSLYNFIYLWIIAYIAEIKEQRLFNILKNPNEFGDTEFNINAGIGTAITCTAQGSLYLFQNLRFILNSSIIIPNYWNSEVAFIPTCTAGIGFRF